MSKIKVSIGARLSARTYGQEDGGNINIKVRNAVPFDGVGIRGASGAFTSVQDTGIGNAGDINITSRTLLFANSSQLSSTNTFSKLYTRYETNRKQ